MPIIGNFPKRQTYASEETRGIMTKEDVAFLHSLGDKVDTSGNIVGNKVHFMSPNALTEDGITFRLNDTIIIPSKENEFMIAIISDNNTPLPGKGEEYVVPISNNLFLKLAAIISGSDSVYNTLSLMSENYDEKISTLNLDDINVIPTTADNAELASAKVDEQGVTHSDIQSRINSIGVLSDDKTIRRYGVKFNDGCVSGDRLYDACGKVAKASTNIFQERNDFDSIYPWSEMIRCNGYYDQNGKFIVTAYDGEPGFSLTDNNVWVEIPKFYISEDISEDGTLVMEVSNSANLYNHRIPEKFIDSNGNELDKVYIASYKMSEVDGVAKSVSGVDVFHGSYDSMLAKIREIDNNHCGYTADDFEILRFLFSVEYAIRSNKTVLTGYVNKSDAAYKTGYTDTVLGPTGSPVSNISGMYPCRYRYIEDPWGNDWTAMYQVLVKNNKISYCKAAANLGSSIDENYTELDYSLPEATEYILKLGYDATMKSCNFPVYSEGGNSSLGYCDLFIATPNPETTTAVYVGGSKGSNCGLYSVNTSVGCADESDKFSTRLSYSK